MSADENLYRCPVCGKPFDMSDKLADFALAAHRKDHRTGSLSAPDTTRGGRGRGGSGFGRRVADLVEDAVEGIGDALGRILDP